MEYVNPFGVNTPDAPYVDRNTPGATNGSKVGAKAIEHPMREIVAAIEAAGLTPDGEDLTQLAQAIREMLSVGALIGVQMFAASGTYTPTAGARSNIVELVGAGGAGGSGRSTASGFIAGGAGGGAGGYAKSRYLLSDLSLPVAVTIGAGGTVASVTTPGGDGGGTLFGAYMTGGGGKGGNSTLNVTEPSGTIRQVAGARGGSASGGNLINAWGGVGGLMLITTTGNSTAGDGGNSFFSAGREGARGATAAPGLDGVLGAGGSGGLSTNGSSDQFGGAGGDGFCLVWEYA